MRLKSELYKKEQGEIVDKIIHILDLENKIYIRFMSWIKRRNPIKIMELIQK